MATHTPTESSLEKNIQLLGQGGCRGGQAVNGLAADIRKALSEAGISFDDQKFVPHITVVRKASGNPGRIKVPRSETVCRRLFFAG